MQSEQEVLAAGNSFDRITDDGAPSFLPLPGITMPLSRQRLLFNDTHTTSANRLYRLTEDKQLRLLFNYTHDRTTQQQGSDETYYFAQDTVRTLHNQNYRLLTDCLNGELNYEIMPTTVTHAKTFLSQAIGKTACQPFQVTKVSHNR